MVYFEKNTLFSMEKNWYDCGEKLSGGTPKRIFWTQNWPHFIPFEIVSLVFLFFRSCTENFVLFSKLQKKN